MLLDYGFLSRTRKDTYVHRYLLLEQSVYETRQFFVQGHKDGISESLDAGEPTGREFGI